MVNPLEDLKDFINGCLCDEPEVTETVSLVNINKCIGAKLDLSP